LVEQLTLNQQVQGSIPWRLTNRYGGKVVKVQEAK
jgi:hypothetical protein